MAYSFRIHIDKQTIEDKYPLENLKGLRWDAYDGENSPQKFCAQVVADGWKLVSWNGQPIADCIWMLFYTEDKNRVFPSLPVFYWHEEECHHDMLNSEDILCKFGEYVQK